MTAKIQIAVARELTGFVWDVLRRAWQANFPAAPASCVDTVASS
jgi:hypothetical protein